jgi:hypothetical protein
MRLGHCTSPTLRALSGGIEIVMLAKDRPGPRAPENISEGSVGLRVVATSMSTWLVPGAAAGTGTRTPLRVEQPPRVSAKARHTQNLREAEVMNGSSAGDGDHFDITCSSFQDRLLAETIGRTAE